MACRPARSMTSSQALGWGGGDLQVRSEPDLLASSTSPPRVPGPAPRPCRVPVCVPRRHLCQSPSRRPGRVEGGDSGDRRDRTGDREVLGVEVGDSEDGAFWIAFLRACGLVGSTGVQLVISDQHLGLREAISAVILGAAWQRCRCISSATSWRRSRRDRRTWSPPRCARSSRNPTPTTSADSSTRSSPCSPASSPTPPRCSPTPRRRPRVLRVSRSALAQDLVDEPARTRQRRDQTPHQRRRHLPQRRRRRQI